MTEALIATGLSVSLSGRELISGVSLRLAPGDCLGLVGPNGAGKTTLLRALLGLHRPSSGSVEFGKTPVAALGGPARAARVAWLPQGVAPLEPLSALEFVLAARYRFSEGRAHALNRARECLARTGSSSLEDRSVTTLSGGEFQRVAFAAMLAQEAPLLLLDEPANHLDPAQQAALYRLIGELWAEGRGVLVITHDINLLAHLGRPGAVSVLGLACGRELFREPYDSPKLADALGRLFSLPFATLGSGSRRVFIPEPAGAP